jgi:hypothetical protein
VTRRPSPSTAPSRHDAEAARRSLARSWAWTAVTAAAAAVLATMAGSGWFTAAAATLAVAGILAGWRAYRRPHTPTGPGPAAVSVAVLVTVAAALAITGATRR